MAISERTGTRPRRVTSAALLVAVGLALALIAVAVLAPVYERAGAPSAGPDTLVGVNGPGVLLFVAVPLLLSLAVAYALRRRATGLGWTLTGLLALVALPFAASIGLLLVPVVVALAVACATSR